MLGETYTWIFKKRKFEMKNSALSVSVITYLSKNSTFQKPRIFFVHVHNFLKYIQVHLERWNLPQLAITNVSINV